MNTTPDKVVRSVGDVVAAFGGTKATADWADVGMSAVSNWLASGSIPRGYHLRLYLELQRRGLLVDPGLFGIPQPSSTDKSAVVAA